MLHICVKLVSRYVTDMEGVHYYRCIDDIYSSFYTRVDMCGYVLSNKNSMNRIQKGLLDSHE